MALTIKLDLDNRGLRKGLLTAKSSLQKTSAQLDAMSSSLARKFALGSAALGGLVYGIKKLVSEASDLETTTTQFAVLTGSISRAKKLTEELVEFGAKTPFELKELAQTSKILLGFGFTAEKITENLQFLGDISSAVGVPIETLGTIFGQVNSVGKLTGERLNQLNERAVPIGPAIAKTMGIAENAVRDLVSQGKVSAEVFNKALKSIAQEGGLAYEGMIKRSKTLGGVMSNFEDIVAVLSQKIGMQLLPTVKKITMRVIEWFEAFASNKQLIKDIGIYIQMSVAALSAFVVAAGSAAAITKGLSIGMKMAGVATKAFQITLTGSQLALAGISKVMKITTLLMSGKFLKAMKGARLSTNLMTMSWKGLGIAIKGAIGATGIGLLIVFLPELLETAKNNWDQIVAVTKQALEIMINGIKHFSKAFKMFFTGNFKGAKKEFENFQNAFKNMGKQLVKTWKETPGLIEKAAEKARKEEEEMMKHDMKLAELRKKQELKKQKDAEAAARQKAFDESDLGQSILKRQEAEEEAEDLAFQEKLIQKTERDEMEKEQQEKFLREKSTLFNALEEKRLKDENAKRKKYLETRLIHGKQFAELEAALESDKAKAVSTAVSAGARLMQSQNERAFRTGKAMAIAESIISTIQSATQVFAQLNAALPFLAPAAGIAAAAPIMQMGFENVNRIKATTFKRAAKGGIVGRAMGTPLQGDHQPMMLSPGELITPGPDVENQRRASNIIINNAQQTHDDFFSNENKQQVDINFQGQASSLIEADVRRDKALGIGVT